MEKERGKSRGTWKLEIVQEFTCHECMNIEELQVKVRNKGVIVRTDGRNRGDNLTQLELVQNGSLCREAGTTKRS